MFDFLKRAKNITSRTVEVGWILDADKAAFIWDAPRRILREQPDKTHAKAVYNCPAVIDHEARLFEVKCPIDVRLRISFDEKTREPRLINVAGEMSTVRSGTLNQMLVIVKHSEWRHPDRPILQFKTPYLFVADDPVYMTQLPPFTSYRMHSWPGVMIGGRLPINIWARHMMWAFEWHDTSRELTIHRGDPWFYVRFETEDPSRPVRMVEAQMTPELQDYIVGAKAVTNYISQTFSLFSTARERRPKTLLVRKQR